MFPFLQKILEVSFPLPVPRKKECKMFLKKEKTFKVFYALKVLIYLLKFGQEDIEPLTKFVQPFCDGAVRFIS